MEELDQLEPEVHLETMDLMESKETLAQQAYLEVPVQEVTKELRDKLELMEKRELKVY